MSKPTRFRVCSRNDGTRGYRLQGRSYNGLSGLVLGQLQRQIRWIHEDSTDASWEKYYSMCGMAGKTSDLVFCMWGSLMSRDKTFQTVGAT